MAPDGSLERCFHFGLVLGFNAVISILQQQDDAFQIGRRELRLDEIKPNGDLRYETPDKSVFRKLAFVESQLTKIPFIRS